MVKEFRSKEALDFNSYDLEHSELLAVDWHPEIKEIKLKLRLPVAGWQYREKWNKFLRSLRLESLISDPCVEYVADITFLGVTEVRETLLSQGHEVQGLEQNDKTWMQAFIFRLDEIRIVKLGADVFRFYLRTEDLKLDFSFVDCLARYECVEIA